VQDAFVKLYGAWSRIEPDRATFTMRTYGVFEILFLDERTGPNEKNSYLYSNDAPISCSHFDEEKYRNAEPGSGDEELLTFTAPAGPLTFHATEVGLDLAFVVDMVAAS
jgi:hypothetical protein